MLNNVGELRKDSFGLDNDGLVYSRKKPSDSLHPRYRKQVSRLDLTCHKFFLNSKSEQREREKEKEICREAAGNIGTKETQRTLSIAPICIAIIDCLC